MPTPFDQDLDQCAANHQPLTPLSFLRRTAKVFPNRRAIVHGERSYTYAEFYARACRLASALAHAGIARGDTVSAVLANTPPMLEAHYGVPMTGAVLNTINTRLDADTIAFIFDHAETKVVLVDREFAGTVKQALAKCKVKPLVIDYQDQEFDVRGPQLSHTNYEDFIAKGNPDYAWSLPQDEWDAISLNYTSGTTGNPKGVVCHHRGAFLVAEGNVITTSMPKEAIYLWTLPMFHCNGWGFPWTLSAVGGTHICLRWVRAKAIYEAIARYKVTHLCGAPIVMSVLLGAAQDEKEPFSHAIEFMTAGAPPPEAVISAMWEAGFGITHFYGLTETYGPSVVNEWNPDWEALTASEQAGMKARQGVPYLALEGLSVRDPETMEALPADGKSLGEVMFRGNLVMKGYLKNAKATREAFEGGWFHSGDLGVMHSDGYIQVKDRSKDVIISGGENISSIEVEEAIYKHPAVAAVAVVARPCEKWGERPCAIIEVKPGQTLDEEDVITHCKTHLARFKVPGSVVFQELPKTSTGKIQKFKLRDVVRQLELP